MFNSPGSQYLQRVLAQQATAPYATLLPVFNHFQPLIEQWANGYCLAVKPSGSYAKGTAVKCSSDIDLFISLLSSVPESLSQIYESLHSYLKQRGYSVRKQNVSIRALYGSISVDLVPGKKQTILTSDHSIFVSKRATWQKTNVDTHIQTVQNSGRTSVMRLLKIWRERHNLDFPSLYLELATIRALDGSAAFTLEAEFSQALGWLSQNIETARIVDPANGNNVLSDDLNALEKRAISSRAHAAVQAQTWNQVVW